MKIVEITEDRKEILCDNLKRVKEAIDALEHELKESYVDTRKGYPYGYDRDRDYRYHDRDGDRERYGY